MRLFVRSSAAASILALALTAIALGTPGAAAQTKASQTSAVASLEALTGWWRYDYAEFGCGDEDGQYRAALGRYEINSDRQLVATDGPLRFGFYDGECELIEPLFRDGKLEAVAICTNEGEAFNGRATIEAVGQDAIAITSPTINSTLIACDPGQARGIAAIAANMTPSPSSRTAPSTGALDIGMPPSATNPDALNMLGIEVGETQTPSPPADAQALSTQPAPPAPAVAPAVPQQPAFDASSLNPQRNAVARVIADYCQPDFYETGHWGNGEWDQTYYERYERQLLVKYLSDCKSFKGGEYLAFTVLDEMLSRNPHLFPAGPAQLSDTHAVVAGFYLRMKNDEEAQPCALPNVMGDNDARLWRTLDDLLARASQGDQFYVASGYYAANEVSQRPSIVTMNVPSACRGRQQQRMLVSQMAIGAGLFLPL